MSIQSSNKQELLESFGGSLTKRYSFGGVSFRNKQITEDINTSIVSLTKTVNNSKLGEKRYKAFLEILQKTYNDIELNNAKIKPLCAQDDQIDFDSRVNFLSSLQDTNWYKMTISTDKLHQEKIRQSSADINDIDIQNIFFTTENIVYHPPLMDPFPAIFFIKAETFNKKDKDFLKITDIICGNVFDTKLLKKNSKNQTYNYRNIIVTNAQICYSDDTFLPIKADNFPFTSIDKLRYIINLFDYSNEFDKMLKSNKSNSLLKEILLNNDILK